MRRVGTPCPRVYENAHDTISFVIVIASGTKCSVATQEATTPPGYNLRTLVHALPCRALRHSQ
jgi:hypothetical protein